MMYLAYFFPFLVLFPSAMDGRCWCFRPQFFYEYSATTWLDRVNIQDCIRPQGESASTAVARVLHLSPYCHSSFSVTFTFLSHSVGINDIGNKLVESISSAPISGAFLKSIEVVENGNRQGGVQDRT
ncbi:hypothetical protein BKA64DRAFT_377214 [Cadophora sp. MPI-SDFR-AT-0126]|nr:hypothetical protein BKA64DRAFT_377214 [Leotiomycetes sp. MPI-SDFR-AT-0126]